jgi:hypothetical protein
VPRTQCRRRQEPGRDRDDRRELSAQLSRRPRPVRGLLLAESGTAEADIVREDLANKPGRFRVLVKVDHRIHGLWGLICTAPDSSPTAGCYAVWTPLPPAKGPL